MTLFIAYILLKHAGLWSWGTFYPYVAIALWAGHVYFHDYRGGGCTVNAHVLADYLERIVGHLRC